MPVYDTRSALQKCLDALDAKKRGWYGSQWSAVDWYGQPIRKPDHRIMPNGCVKSMAVSIVRKSQIVDKGGV